MLSEHKTIFDEEKEDSFFLIFTSIPNERKGVLAEARKNYVYPQLSSFIATVEFYVDLRRAYGQFFVFFAADTPLPTASRCWRLRSRSSASQAKRCKPPQQSTSSDNLA